MSAKRFLAIFLPGLLVLGSCSKGTEPIPITGSFILTNFTLIDGNGGDPVENAVLIVDSGVIVAVGPEQTTPLPEQVMRVDLNGATVLPGFFNAHIHNGLNQSSLEAWAQEGVTAVRDLCGPAAFWNGDQLSANPVCARLIMAGPMLTVPDGYPMVPWGSTCGWAITSVEDAAVRARQIIINGADILKLAIECGQDFRMEIPSLSPEEASAIVEVAHEYGTKASAHVLVSYDLSRALDAGVDDIAHMIIDGLSDEQITRMIDNDVYWVPTLELWYHVGHGRADLAVANLRKFVQAGGLVATGTDYDGYYAEFELGMPMMEMALMRQAGMTPMEIIVAGTKNAAAVCNRQDDLGTLEAGKAADILVIGGDPLEELAALENVILVIRDGVVIRDER